MADYLQKHGIAESRIIQESKSGIHYETSSTAKKLMQRENASVGIVTSNFHMFHVPCRSHMPMVTEAGAGHREQVHEGHAVVNNIWS